MVRARRREREKIFLILPSRKLQTQLEQNYHNSKKSTLKYICIVIIQQLNSMLFIIQ